GHTVRSSIAWPECKRFHRSGTHSNGTYIREFFAKPSFFCFTDSMCVTREVPGTEESSAGQSCSGSDGRKTTVQGRNAANSWTKDNRAGTQRGEQLDEERLCGRRPCGGRQRGNQPCGGQNTGDGPTGRSGHPLSAVDVDHLAGDEAGRVRCE